MKNDFCPQINSFEFVWGDSVELCQGMISNSKPAHLPGFGILTHIGRKSGKVYRTPVNVFRAPEGFLITPTYGQGSERSGT